HGREKYAGIRAVDGADTRGRRLRGSGVGPAASAPKSRRGAVGSGVGPDAPAPRGTRGRRAHAPPPPRPTITDWVVRARAMLREGQAVDALVSLMRAGNAKRWRETFGRGSMKR